MKAEPPAFYQRRHQMTQLVHLWDRTAINPLLFQRGRGQSFHKGKRDPLAVGTTS